MLNQTRQLYIKKQHDARNKAKMNGEQEYLHLLRKIIDHGEDKDTRNAMTKSLFGEMLTFDLTHGFPLLTTKRVFWRGVVEELLWFLKGNTNANMLKDKGVNIWNDNSTREFLDNRGLSYEEGECGPIYGFQWRAFNGEFPSKRGGVDQLRWVIQELRQNPSSRRAIISGWNPVQLDMMCLPPCHVLYNFNMSSKYGLSCHMYQRSCDTCAGLPFNIASTALLTHIVAAVLEVPVHKVVISIGDAHIYHDHLEGAKEQVTRSPYEFPYFKLLSNAPGTRGSIDDNIAWIESLTFEDFALDSYKYHPTIKYVMIP